MVGMGMTAATIIMHQGINTGSVFGHIFDFTGLPVIARVLLALVVCIVLCTVFTTIAGFFTAKFKMHPFISTMEIKQARQCAGPVLRSGSEGIRTVYCSSTTP